VGTCKNPQHLSILHARGLSSQPITVLSLRSARSARLSKTTQLEKVLGPAGQALGVGCWWCEVCGWPLVRCVWWVVLEGVGCRMEHRHHSEAV
jgi:hypothetical protein